jgi:hypothetical protein
MPPNLILDNGFATSTGITATSAYPYYGNGPIDFSQLNFVRTSQVDYYYDQDASGTWHLVSQVTQTFDVTETFLVIGVAIIFFIIGLIKFIKFVRKQGK